MKMVDESDRTTVSEEKQNVGKRVISEYVSSVTFTRREFVKIQIQPNRDVKPTRKDIS